MPDHPFDLVPAIGVIPAEPDAVRGAFAGGERAAYAVLVGASDSWAPEVERLLQPAFLDSGLHAPDFLAGQSLPQAPGEVSVVPLPAGPVARLILLPAGDDDAGLRNAAALAARAAGSADLLLVHPIPARDPVPVIEGTLLALPARHLGPGGEAKSSPRVLLVGAAEESRVHLGVTSARAHLHARALANTPSNVKSPQWLAEHARSLGSDAGLRVRVWDERDLARDGFGGILAVGAASATPPRLVQLDCRPTRAATRPIVLVGKGITFDTGGVNVKSAAAMLPMKTDMSGAAVVLAVMTGLRALDVRRRVIGLMPLAQNAIGGAAYRPSDVVTQYGGRTVEISNTDAEGRIVLADALAYAVANLAPAALVDIATLTGHASLALSRVTAPSYASDEALRARVHAGFEAAGEALWAMPLVEDYRAALESDVADLCHIGPIGARNAGSILAALFLREFTGGVPWVHLDIAGPGRSESDTGILAKGGTGYGARGLLRWLTQE